MNFIRFIILSQFCSLLTLAADELPPNVVIVPVAQAQRLALHPSKPVVYVGLPTGGENGLATLLLDEKGIPIGSSRKDFADGIVEAETVPKGSEYSVGYIAVNPVLPQIYLGARPKKFSTFRANTAAADVVAITLDETGFPAEKTASLRSDWRISPVQHLDCDPLGRFVYLGELHGSLGIWPVGDEPIEPMPKLLTPSARKHPPSNRKSDMKRVSKNPFGSQVLITDWIYVPEWRRYYGSTKEAYKVIFSFSDDGAACVFAQSVAIQNRFEITPLVSVKHQKMYVPNAQQPTLGIYQLTREGRLTSLPRRHAMEPVRLACLDDKNDRLYVVTPQSGLAVYPLDADGNPTGEPRRYNLKSGVVNDAVLSPTTGILYLACSAPAEEKP